MSPDRFRRGAFGFSLTELLVVMFIGATALAISFPAMSKMVRRGRLEEGAGRMESALRLSRQKALARRTHYLVTLNPGANTYRIAFEDSSGSWEADRDSLYTMPNGVNFQGSINGAGFSYQSASDVEILLEPRGTLANDDAPTNLVFFNDTGDTIEIEMVRTGRVRSWIR